MQTAVVLRLMDKTGLVRQFLQVFEAILKLIAGFVACREDQPWKAVGTWVSPNHPLSRLLI